MIIPGILEKDWLDIEDKIETVYNRNIYGNNNDVVYKNRKVNTIQIDFCDGKYVKSQTWAPLQDLMIDSPKTKELLSLIEKGMPYWEDFEYEADLMVSADNMPAYIDRVSELGFSKVVLHIESIEPAMLAIDQAIDSLMTVGIASRDINLILELLDSDDYKNKIDYIQIMGIENVGYQHEPFDESTIDKIKIIKDILNSTPSSLAGTFPREGFNTNGFVNKIRIQIDGGMSQDTIKLCEEVGADNFVMGSAYFVTNSD